MRAELFHRIECTLGEGPFWHDGMLGWVDIDGGALHRLELATGKAEAFAFGEKIGVAVPARDGRLIVALASRIARFDPKTKDLSLVSLPDPPPAQRRFNDGKCDPRGRLLVGTMDLAVRPGVGALYRIDPSGSWAKLVPDVGVSNGLAWTASGETMYFIDSFTRTLSAFDYDLERGELSGRRIVRTFPAEDGVPDGMAIDRAGRLWIALWGGGAVVCCEPQTGAELARVEVPASLTTSCAFGGPALDELFITSARSNLTPDQLAREPLAGSVFRVRPGAVGFPAVMFGG